jgi:hypothetical protein
LSDLERMMSKKSSWETLACCQNCGIHFHCIACWFP